MKAVRECSAAAGVGLAAGPTNKWWSSRLMACCAIRDCDQLGCDPNVRRLMKEGHLCRRRDGVYPTITWALSTRIDHRRAPDQTAFGNQRPNSEAAVTIDGRFLRARTLWQAATTAGIENGFAVTLAGHCRRVD